MIEDKHLKLAGTLYKFVDLVEVKDETWHKVTFYMKKTLNDEKFIGSLQIENPKKEKYIPDCNWEIMTKGKAKYDTK